MSERSTSELRPAPRLYVIVEEMIKHQITSCSHVHSTTERGNTSGLLVPQWMPSFGAMQMIYTNRTKDLTQPIEREREEKKNYYYFYLLVHSGNLATSDHFHQSECPGFVNVEDSLHLL